MRQRHSSKENKQNLSENSKETFKKHDNGLSAAESTSEVGLSDLRPELRLEPLSIFYRAFFPVCRKVLKMLFWEIPPADWPTLQLPTAQAGPRNSH